MAKATGAKEKARNAMIYKIKTARLNKLEEAE
jgi:antitoxin CptB